AEGLDRGGEDAGERGEDVLAVMHDEAQHFAAFDRGEMEDARAGDAQIGDDGVVAPEKGREDDRRAIARRFAPLAARRGDARKLRHTANSGFWTAESMRSFFEARHRTKVIGRLHRRAAHA